MKYKVFLPVDLRTNAHQRVSALYITKYIQRVPLSNVNVIIYKYILHLRGKSVIFQEFYFHTTKRFPHTDPHTDYTLFTLFTLYSLPYGESKVKKSKQKSKEKGIVWKRSGRGNFQLVCVQGYNAFVYIHSIYTHACSSIHLKQAFWAKSYPPVGGVQKPGKPLLINL